MIDAAATRKGKMVNWPKCNESTLRENRDRHSSLDLGNGHCQTGHWCLRLPVEVLLKMRFINQAKIISSKEKLWFSVK